MPDFNFLLLHVADPAVSATFYNALLGIPIVDQSPTFALLPLREGVMLGLWCSGDVEPTSSGQTGASEVAFGVADAAAVASLHADWQQRGLVFLQEPTLMSFGMTFVVCDPDGHRLRVFAPVAA